MTVEFCSTCLWEVSRCVCPPVTELPSRDAESATHGPDFDEELDGERINTQLDRVRNYMLPLPEWRTLAEISRVTGDPPASVSAQLRHLRKARFGAFMVVKRRRGDPGSGLWEYRVEHSGALG